MEAYTPDEMQLLDADAMIDFIIANGKNTFANFRVDFLSTAIGRKSMRRRRQELLTLIHIIGLEAGIYFNNKEVIEEQIPVNPSDLIPLSEADLL